MSPQYPVARKPMNGKDAYICRQNVDDDDFAPTGDYSSVSAPANWIDEDG